MPSGKSWVDVYYSPGQTDSLVAHRPVDVHDEGVTGQMRKTPSWIHSAQQMPPEGEGENLGGATSSDSARAQMDQ